MEPSQDKLYGTALQTIGAVSKLPVVRVDRDAFLQKHFSGSPHLDVILERGPQAVYSPESLRKKAGSIIKNSAVKTSAASFAMGLPGNPAVMVAAGGADVAQYFGFAINLAQQIAICSARTSSSTAVGSCPRLRKSGSSRISAPCSARLAQQHWCRRLPESRARISASRSRPAL